MAKYQVSVPWHATVTVEVEAESEDEAVEFALEEEPPEMCAACTTKVEFNGVDDTRESNVNEVDVD